MALSSPTLIRFMNNRYDVNSFYINMSARQAV
jgi:hypothetical protein